MRRSWLLGSLCLSLSACSSDSGDSDGGGGQANSGKVESSLEIFSWLTAPGEREALEVLFEQLNDEYPDLSIVNAAANDPQNARDKLKSRMESGEPPDSFQTIGGQDLLTWIDQKKMADIDDLVEANGWGDVFPEPVLNLMQKDGHYYAVPLNIERDNNLYYSTQFMADHDLEPPRSLDDFYAACATLQEDDLVPLALPAAGWVLALVAFEAMMPAVNGGQFYLDFMNGKADPDSDELRELVVEFGKVIDCSNVRTADPRWTASADLIVSGDAAFYVMGDWAKGYFEKDRDADDKPRAALVAGTDFDVVPALGSEGYFTFNSIVFGIPRGAAHPKAASAFLEVVASKEGQLASNAVKGSVPARNDVPTTDFDAIVKGAIEDFQAAAEEENRLVPGYASLTSFDFQTEINPSLLVFAVGGARARELDPGGVPEDEAEIPAQDIDYLINKIKANYYLLE